MRSARLVLFAGTLVALLAGCSPPGSPERLQTVVLITIDTLRADHLGTYGYPRPTSPFLDSLAENGVLFENAFASSSHTAPSHTTLFTSLSPASHGVLKNGARLVPDRYTTLAESLSEQGFETGAVLSTRFLEPVARGFRHVDIPAKGSGWYRIAERTLEEARDWLGALDPDSRAFLWIHLYDVHRRRPSGPHIEYLPRVRGTKADQAAHQHHLKSVNGLNRFGEFLRTNINRYDAQIAYVDAQLELLHGAVAELRGRQPMLWVVTADHGEGLGNHNHVGHGRYLYREQLHVPLIVHASPPRWSPSRVPGMVRLVDLYPTLMELVGAQDAEVVQEMEGISFVPLLDSPGSTLPIDYLFAQRRPIDKKRRRNGWEDGLVLAAQNLDEKYVYFETRPDEYYDLRADPNETTNLAGENLPEAERLRRWLMRRHLELKRAGPKGEQEIMPEHVEELRALGYIE